MAHVLCLRPRAWPGGSQRRQCRRQLQQPLLEPSDHCCGIRGFCIALRLRLAGTRRGQNNLHRLSQLLRCGRRGGKGGKHHLNRSPVSHTSFGVVDRTACPPSGRPSPAPCLETVEVLLWLPSCRTSSFCFGTHAKHRLSCGNNANPEQLSRMLRCMPCVAFPALETVLSGLEGRVFTRPTQLVPNPFFFFVLRLTMSHVVISCVGVKHVSGASGESTVVSALSPGYPHVWSDLQVFPVLLQVLCFCVTPLIQLPYLFCDPVHVFVELHNSSSWVLFFSRSSSVSVLLPLLLSR